MRELEVTIDHLRRLYQQEVVQVRQENEKLKEILQAHGIHYNLGSPSTSQTYTSPGSLSLIGSPDYTGQTGSSTAYTSMSPSHQHPSTIPLLPSSYHPQQSTLKSIQAPSGNLQNLDYNDMGLNFVAEYDRTPYLSPPPN
jgi:hypothetical protein